MATGDETRGNVRLDEQVKLVLEAFDDVATDPPDWLATAQDAGRSSLRFLYRTGVILVRDEYLDRVREVVPGEVVDGLTRGVSLYRPAFQSTLDALATIDAKIGRDVATPDHMVSVAPKSLCPATEPVETKTTKPVPVRDGRRCSGEGIRVAIVDTGLFDGIGAVRGWLDGVTGDSEGPVDQGDIGPYVGHGTFIAGVVRAMAPKADVHVERVPIQRVGVWRESDMVAQLDEALASGADIISVSAGTNTRRDAASLALAAWYEASLRHRPDVVFVAAAGNNGSNTPFWPAAFPWALAVGATTADGTSRAHFSNYGSWVGVFAPGEGHLNAFARGSYTCTETPHVGEVRRFDAMAEWAGTSFAAPLVAGMIAARASGLGIDVVTARDQLLHLARAAGVSGVGPVLLPEMTCATAQDACPTCGRELQVAASAAAAASTAGRGAKRSATTRASGGKKPKKA